MSSVKKGSIILLHGSSLNSFAISLTSGRKLYENGVLLARICKTDLYFFNSKRLVRNAFLNQSYDLVLNGGESV